MKKWMFAMFSVSVLCLLIYFAIGQTNYAFADDDKAKIHEHYEKHEEHEKSGEKAVKESGKLLGWGAVSIALSAGALFPLRRKTKWIIKTFPNAKQFFVSLLKLLTKWHMLIGAAAFALAAAHGIFMYFSEGKLETREYVGIIGTAFMGIAAIFGTVLSKNKASSSIRSAHIGLLFTAGVFIVFHIFL
ncbi:hypothetical protein [Saccharococcus caldoxylosilyticus]|uniref:Ferric oxidoreductase domain-containing protein n=2 Tax=Saccharococcus caldoxylosilyticus TaxID=81408 RepID=A0A023DJS7_9BACL|nr:hypothetical protein [Parageobacillus caldoxylosilyticus]KYD14291.1 hypothetical protein B4119_1453 [Parageobacillus caldoxylosilyticus]MBB3854194.1 hypothetical protein [Parageobacillus caldoxylosilyticus]GAJ41266.1 hypothetical protein GCA01S_062_00150 [Parageobacillus caldoxylosilyticus NBRC 107762]